MAGPSDTSEEAERIWIAALRAMTPERKWRQLSGLHRLGREFHAAGSRRRQPGATDADVRADWLHLVPGSNPAHHLSISQGKEASMDTQQVLCEVVAALDELGIRYALGGSMASSLHGTIRFTFDADILIEPFPGREAEFVKRFAPPYYVSLEAVRQAMRDRASFNVIHTEAGFKVDFFVKKREFDESALTRRRSSETAHGWIEVVSPEDIILLKLEWYRLGNEASERQWDDVLGVVRVQGDRLDRAYLDQWARELGVSDLLERALTAAGA